MTILYLVRHGETDWNAARRIQGSTDIPLNDTGRGQARRTGQVLRRRPIDHIVASPLSRAFETASIIAEQLGLPHVEPLQAVVERAYGAAEGFDYQTLESLYPEGTAVPGRESTESVRARALPALVALAEARRGQSVVVVSHGGVIRSLVTGLAPYHQLIGVPITNGSVHSFRLVEGTLELTLFDDPIDAASVESDDLDFDHQNALAARDPE